MGISFSIPCDPCINKSFQCLDKKVDYTRNLEKNLVALETNMRELKARQDDLLRRVTREEDRGLQRLAEVQVWVTAVETIDKKVNDLFSNKNVQLPRLCLFGVCSKSLKSSYQYGKSVVLTLNEVEKLKTSVFEVVAEKPQTPEVQEIQLQRIIVGQETMLEKAWNHLMDDAVDIMGMYGMGGVGKTTLLTQLNNKFSKARCGFDFVIWIVVSKELHLEKIRDEIAQKVGIGGNKKEIIYNFLRKKRFVLFLDDIWEKVDLAEIGVPFPTTENKCKVAFTTRLQDVCGQMGVEDPMGVTCLAENDAFDLFEKKVGQITLGSDPEIPELAKIIARKCSGLPLALNVIGETMSYKRKKQEWLHARDVLNSYASEFSGMEDKILPLLKYSYDNLKEEEFKSCLLYCALFPEDYKIGKERLIDYWICEGIMDGTKGLEWAKNKGYEIIGSLVRASLLMEEFTSKGRDVVHMHDVVREMALWIASDLGKQKEAFIVRAGVGLRGVPKVENWRALRRMSLMENKIQHLAGRPECLELTTLLLQRVNLAKISSEFFKFMPKLAVLDLSKNRNLYELPNGISELVSLQYLNLSQSGIRRLPMGMKELKKLIHLDLEKTRMLLSFAGMSNLHNLKVLKLAVEEYFYSSLDLEEAEELETLEHLEVLTLSISRPPVLERYLSSHRLTSCTRELQIKYLEPSGVISLPVTLEKLCEFRIFRCNIFEIKMVRYPRIPCFLSLSNVVIRSCHFLKEMTFLMFAPNLKVLDVCDSKQLKEIINKEKACEVGGESEIVPFPNLVSLHLRYLPSLKSIYWRPLPFSCLKKINVEGCPNLNQRALNSQSGTHGENGLHIQEE